MKAERPSMLIGRTPLLRLRLRSGSAALWLKVEKTNPGQSMKDRMALSMVADAEASGRLKPGGTIVESSSGNTGTALAWIAAERGYTFIAVVDDHAAPEKLRAMRAYGAKLVRVQSDVGEGHVSTAKRERCARDLAARTAGAVYLEQAHNPANASAYASMARELVEDLGCVDFLVGSVGTGGSLSGTARELRRSCPGITVVGVEPIGSIIFGGAPGPYLQSGTGTPGGVEIGRNVNFAVIDRGVRVGDAAAFTTARWLARNCGILIGGAAGAVVLAALETMEDDRTAVALVADGGEKYLETIYDDEWIAARGLHDAAIEAKLARTIARYAEI